jgi:hypothetical protein
MTVSIINAIIVFMDIETIRAIIESIVWCIFTAVMIYAASKEWRKLTAWKHSDVISTLEPKPLKIEGIFFR